MAHQGAVTLGTAEYLSCMHPDLAPDKSRPRGKGKRRQDLRDTEAIHNVKSEPVLIVYVVGFNLIRQIPSCLGSTYNPSAIRRVGRAVPKRRLESSPTVLQLFLTRAAPRTTWMFPGWEEISS